MKKETKKTVAKKKSGRKPRSSDKIVRSIKFSLSLEDDALFDELCFKESRTYAAQIEYLIKNTVKGVKMQKERVEKEAEIAFKEYVKNNMNTGDWFEDTRKIALGVGAKLGITCEWEIIDIQKLLEEDWFEEYVYSKDKNSNNLV